MSRSLILLAIVLYLLPCPTADARGGLARWIRGGWSRGPSQRSIRHRSSAEPQLFGMGIGVGSYPPYGYPRPGQFNPHRFDSYLYDPYRSGSFEPPDLLNDPYFRERHRYDSQFPGRRYRP